MRFKVGQKVKVVNCYSGGNFENGDIVEIVQIGTDDGEEKDCYGAISPYDNWKWYLYEDEISPVTNADKIRSMSDEELAKFIIEDRWDCNECPSGQENTDNPFGNKCDNQCVKHCLEWLKEDIKNG